jgi:hypothetical protein
MGLDRGKDRERTMGQQIHPMIAAEIRKLESKIGDLASENRRMSAELADERRAREVLERQDVHIDDMPGKQLPFKYQINIDLPAGTNSPVTGTVNVSRDGPFVARRLFASLLITDAPVLTVGATVEDYTQMIGRFAPISSRWEYYWWARDVADNAPDSYVPPPLDFEWEYNDGGSERNRQDKPISGDILFMRSDEGYFMNNEIFSAGTTISFTVYPLRAIPILSLTVGEETDTGDVDVQLKVTFDGFKVLQPLQM